MINGCKPGHTICSCINALEPGVSQTRNKQGWAVTHVRSATPRDCRDTGGSWELKSMHKEVTVILVDARGGQSKVLHVNIMIEQTFFLIITTWL